MKSISKKPLLFLYLLIFVFFNIHEIAAKSNSIDLSFSINCPPNVTIGCSSNIYNLSIYGNATYTSGYNNHSAGSPVVTYYINSCNTGYITRTWTVEDNYWRNQSCTQTIFVGSIGAASLDIKWPEDIELEGCNPNTHPSKFAPGYDYPTHNYLSCRGIC